MDFYKKDTPATNYFGDSSFPLRSAVSVDGKITEPEIRFWFSFDFMAGELHLNVYEDYTLKSSKTISPFTAGDLPLFVFEIRSEYGVRIPETYIHLFDKFLTLSYEGFGFDVNLDEGNSKVYICEQCGDYNENTIKGFYFPAVSPVEPASLAVGWDYGCYGGEKVAGPYEKVKDEVLELLSRASREDFEPLPVETKQALTEFIQKVNNVNNH